MNSVADAPLVNPPNLNTQIMPTSFVGRSGRFYVACPEGWKHVPRYAARSSVEAYNTRSELPEYLPASEALDDFGYELSIYTESMTTTPPVYPADRDETDYGLTPARYEWAERFARVKGENRYVA